MRINEVNWKNYKSYGGTMQSLKFKKGAGELILLVGPNGNGKSAFLDIFDITVFGQVLNKRGTKLANKLVPNRTNGDMFASIDFDVDDNFKIERSMQNSGSPLKVSMKINDKPYDKANKIEDKITESIRFDFKSFKSFISMDINNFKNFMGLTPEDKRTLIDKLFNMEVINDLNKILKQLHTKNETTLGSITKELQAYRNSVDTLQATINKVVEKNKNDNDQKIKELKDFIASNKEAFIELESNKDDMADKINKLSDVISELGLKRRGIDKDIEQINEKIDLFKSGKCPTCMTKLIGDLNLLPEFEERLEKTQNIRDTVNKTITDNDTELKTLRVNFNKASDEWSDMLTSLTEKKGQIKKLKEEKEEPDNTEEFKVTLENQKTVLKEKEDECLEVQMLKHVYDVLLPMWGEKGIKRDIIDSIIDPLNEFLDEDMAYLKTRFKVKLDNNFDAHVYEYGTEIDPDTLSTGESKKINMIIMLAYIKMLRLKNEINILFLDEVFASVDVEGIDDLLYLFKKFANDRDINIILVHHAELKEHMFDRILYARKTTFSYIEEKQIK